MIKLHIYISINHLAAYTLFYKIIVSKKYILQNTLQHSVIFFRTSCSIFQNTFKHKVRFAEQFRYTLQHPVTTGRHLASYSIFYVTPSIIHAYIVLCILETPGSIQYTFTKHVKHTLYFSEHL